MSEVRLLAGQAIIETPHPSRAWANHGHGWAYDPAVKFRPEVIEQFSAWGIAVPERLVWSGDSDAKRLPMIGGRPLINALRRGQMTLTLFLIVYCPTETAVMMRLRWGDE